jgi:hypothetical protein
MAIFPMSGALYPESFWDGMIADLDYYKVKIPLEEIKIPTIINHGQCDDDIPY